MKRKLNRNIYTNLFSKQADGRYFIKMHGLENHFVIFDGRKSPYLPDEDEIKRVCDNNLGVGADQFIILNQPTDLGLTLGATIFMRLLNIDGLEVGACGNATRCVAKLLMDYLNTTVIKIETLAGVLNCDYLDDGRIQCNMGTIKHEAEHIPLSKNIDTLNNVNLTAGPLSNPVLSNIGNPHATFFVNEIESVNIEKWAPLIQKNALFPEQVNVGIAEIIDHHTLKLEVFERPGILTKACGSGACAAVYAANKRQYKVASKMKVILPAGPLTIELMSDNSISMIGPAEYIFSGLLLDTA